MKYLKFKNSQLEASNIIMGCMRLNSLSVKEAQRHIETAVEAGINMFDHADIYGGGESVRSYLPGLWICGAPSEIKLFCRASVPFEMGTMTFQRNIF